MKKLAAGIAAVLALGFVVGCNNASNNPDDSMASTLEQAKKDQNVSGTDVKSKDAPNLKAPAAPAGEDTSKPSADTKGKPPADTKGKAPADTKGKTGTTGK